MDVELLQKRLAREKKARVMAEKLLEEKAAALFEANEKLKYRAVRLSQEVEKQTQAYEEARSQTEVLKGKTVELLSAKAASDEAASRAEQRLWNAIESIPDGFALFNEKDELLVANSAYLSLMSKFEPQIRQFMGYREILELMCKTNSITPDEHEAVKWVEMMYEKHLRDEISGLVVQQQDGRSFRWMERRTEDGGTVAIRTDVTDNILRQRELETARYEAESANRTKSTFLANMSHEIRTPMNGVIGMSDVLLDTVLTSDQRRYVHTIKNSSEALLRIINDVLDFSKIEAKRLELFPEAFDLEEHILQTLRLLDVTAKKKGIRLDYEYSETLPKGFLADPGRIQQIMNNLVGNAVKFTDEGSVRVSVGGQHLRDNIYQVEIVVRDTGIGIPEEHLKDIFNEFSQIENQDKRRYTGTGLGLTITNRLVRLMKGNIHTQSKIGEGTTFTVVLELASIDAARFVREKNEKKVIQYKVNHHDSLDEKSRRIKILAAEDNQTNRFLLQTILNDDALDLHIVENGVELTKTFPKVCPDIVLMDISMPEMDGFTAAKWVRQYEEENGLLSVPIIALTAHAYDAEVDKYIQAGMTDYLAKPYRKSEIFGKLADFGLVTAV